MQIEIYKIFEIEVDGNNETRLTIKAAKFTNMNNVKEVYAYKNNNGKYTIRFMPDKIGKWNYCINIQNNKYIGDFECINTNNTFNHGMVKTNGYHFKYQDGTRFLPFGTTCYAWIHQPNCLQLETLETLKKTCFNKIRMLVFPKFMPYNTNDPDIYPFNKKENGNFDVNLPNEEFFSNLDKRIIDLDNLGIQCDLILFHPYDKWGFSRMSQKDSLIYLSYMIARYGAYKNIWWSLANEYEMLYMKNDEDWDEYGNLILKEDPYRHLTSIHQIIHPYPKKEWMSHLSIQSGEVNRIPEWKDKYKIPVIDDEFGYEGNIEYTWGNLSTKEHVHRFWVCLTRGGYGSHGETFHNEEEILWWSKGGKLHGESESRIAFLKKLMESLSQPLDTFFEPIKNPNENDDFKNDPLRLAQEERFYELVSKMNLHDKTTYYSSSPYILRGDNYTLYYYGRTCPVLAHIDVPVGKKTQIEIIDGWNMTRKLYKENQEGNVRVELPGNELMAILVTFSQSIEINN